jgi:two-component system CheB/CheR fusion protein
VRGETSEEKSFEERLELFHSAFEHSTDAIIITSVEGTIIEVNDAFTKIYGYSREEAIGKSTALIQSEHSTTEFYEEMWSSLAKFNQWKGEIINRRKDGTEVPVWLSITPIFLTDDHDRNRVRKIGYMGIGSDMSDRKNLEQQIIQAEKLATIGQLAAGIAHEIGTPLNIISGNAELIQLDMEESDSGYMELTAIIEQTKRISVMIKQLLDFARPKILSLRPVNINSVIGSVLNFVRLQFSKNGIDVETDLADDPPKVYGDPALLYQVFLNVVMNAFQSMPKGGKLYLNTVSVRETGRENEEPDKVTVTIRDTGEGIPPENIGKLFTPFFSTKEPGKGTGLGLAVTHRIVQEHNGTIVIDSEVDKGTTVTIQFNAFKQK